MKYKYPVPCNGPLNPSMPASRRTKKKVQPIPPPPFRFKGARLAFLQSHVEGYMKATDVGGRHEFLTLLYKFYWERFPWRLPITTDPYPNMVIDRLTDVLLLQESIERDHVMTTTITVRRFHFPAIAS